MRKYDLTTKIPRNLGISPIFLSCEVIIMDKKEKNEMLNSINQALDNFEFRFYQNLFGDIKNAKNPNAYNTAYNEEKFFELRAYDLGVYLYVLEKCIKSKVVQKHRIELLKPMILSILDDSFTLPELNPKTNSFGHIKTPSNQKIYTDRQRRRLFNDENEIFYKVKPEQSNDKRIASLASIFSNNHIPASSLDYEVSRYLANAHFFNMQDSKVKQLLANASLLFAFPLVLDDIIQFMSECNNVFENLGKNDERTKFLREQLTTFPPFMSFYMHVNSLLSLQWFRSTYKDASTFFSLDCKLEYSKLDAKQAKKILLNKMPKKWVMGTLFQAACGFLYHKKTDYAILVFEQCIDLVNSDSEKGNIYHNIAFALRESKDYARMLDITQKSNFYLEKSNDIYNLCISIKLMAESQWYLGHKNDAMKSFNRCEQEGKKLPSDMMHKILLNIGISFGRLGENSLRDKYLTKALPLIPEDNIELILEINSKIGSNFIP